MNIRNIFSSFKLPSPIRMLFYIGGFSALIQHIKAVVYLTNFSEQATDVALCGTGTMLPYTCDTVYAFNESAVLQQTLQCQYQTSTDAYVCYPRADIPNLPTQLTLGIITCDEYSNCNCTSMGNGIALTQDDRFPNANLFYASDKGGTSYGQACPPYVPKEKDEYIKEDEEDVVVKKPALRR